MSHYVYIIYSPQADRYYVGETVDVLDRLAQHNEGFYRKSSTKFASDWDLYFQIECESPAQAKRLERFIKRMKSRQFYFRLRTEPPLVKSLLTKFRE